MKVYWYRYDVVHFASSLDEFERSRRDGRTELRLYKYLVKKETLKGVRLEDGRFILRNARKRFACPSIEEAKQSFIARKERQIKILRSQIRQAESALRWIKNAAEDAEVVEISDYAFMPDILSIYELRNPAKIEEKGK